MYMAGHWTAADVGLIVVLVIGVAILGALGTYVVRASLRDRGGR